MGLILLDSSFVIAVFTPNHIHHTHALNAYDDRNTYVASTITATEVMTGAFKEKNEALIWPQLQRLVRDFLSVDGPISLQAAELRARWSLKTPDAIISATAKIHKAELWTFDAKLAKLTPGARCLA